MEASFEILKRLLCQILLQDIFFSKENVYRKWCTMAVRRLRRCTQLVSHKLAITAISARLEISLETPSEVIVTGLRLCARNWHYCRYAASIVFCSYDSHIVVAPKYPLRGRLVHSKGPPIIIAVTQFASLSQQSNVLRLVVWTISIN